MCDVLVSAIYQHCDTAAAKMANLSKKIRAQHTLSMTLQPYRKVSMIQRMLKKNILESECFFIYFVASSVGFGRGFPGQKLILFGEAVAWKGLGTPLLANAAG